MAGRLFLNDLRQIAAGFVAAGAGSGSLLAYRSSLIGKRNLDPFQSWLFALSPRFIVVSCIVLGLVIYAVLHFVTSRGEKADPPVLTARAEDRSQSAVTTGDNSPIHQHMGPDPVPQRSLTMRQADAIRRALSTAPPTTLVAFRHPSKESQTFLMEFIELLKSAHWEVLDFLGSNKPGGDTIRLGWQSIKTPSFEALMSGLTDAGIVFVTGEFESDPRFVVSLDVGRAVMDDFQAAADRLQ